MIIFLCLIFFLIWFRMMFLKIENYLHILQLEGYNSKKFKNWARQNKIIIYKKNKNSKKPFIYTARAKRLTLIIYSLILLDFLITLTIVFMIFNLIFSSYNINYIILSISILSMSISYFACIYHIFLANYISLFLENKINKRFYNMAKEKIKKLSDNGLITVGITGSYGKTSVKFISSAILSQKFRVLSRSVNNFRCFRMEK